MCCGVDKTPVGELQPLNRYVTTKDVIRFVKNKYDIAPDEQDETWARSHALEANNYFSGPIYPRVAIRELGYVKAFWTQARASLCLRYNVINLFLVTNKKM